MMTVQATSRTILLAAAMWCLPGNAGADDSNAAANAQRIQAIVAARSMLGYPPVVDADRIGCCPNAGAASYASTTLEHQIARLSAALMQRQGSVELSPAQLAEGAY